MRGPAADVGCEAAIVALVGSLRDGLALRKHGRYGAPKLKHVFISDDGGHLLWGDKVCRARASSSSSSPSSSLPPCGGVVHRRRHSDRRRAEAALQKGEAAGAAERSRVATAPRRRGRERDRGELSATAPENCCRRLPSRPQPQRAPPRAPARSAALLERRRREAIARYVASRRDRSAYDDDRPRGRSREPRARESPTLSPDDRRPTTDDRRPTTDDER